MAGFVNGVLVLDSSLVTTSMGDNNDVPCSSSLMYILVSNDLDAITGIDLGGSVGGLILVINIGPSNNLAIKNDSSSSLLANRILTPDGLDYYVPAFNTAILGYDTTSEVWHILRVPDSNSMYVNKSADYTVSPVDDIISCDTAAKTITLPTPVGITGKGFVIKNTSAGNITVDTVSGNIDSNPSVTLTPLQCLTVFSDGTNYGITSLYG